MCNIKDDDLTLKKFFDKACVAEQKHRSFQEIGVSSSHLDSSAGVSVNKWEAKNSDKYGAGLGKSKWQGKFDKSGSGQEEHGKVAQGAGQANARHQFQKYHPQDQQTLGHQASTGAKSKRRGECFKCQQFGHWANECQASCTQQQQFNSVKSCEVVAAQADSAQGQPVQNLNSFKIVARTMVPASVSKWKRVR